VPGETVGAANAKYAMARREPRLLTPWPCGAPRQDGRGGEVGARRGREIETPLGIAQVGRALDEALAEVNELIRQSQAMEHKGGSVMHTGHSTAQPTRRRCT
jgi:hypothetical protein